MFGITEAWRAGASSATLPDNFPDDLTTCNVFKLRPKEDVALLCPQYSCLLLDSTNFIFDSVTAYQSNMQSTLTMQDFRLWRLFAVLRHELAEIMRKQLFSSGLLEKWTVRQAESRVGDAMKTFMFYAFRDGRKVLQNV